MISLLTRLFVPERYQGGGHGVDARVPVIMERIESRSVEPVLVSNSRGQFLQSRRGKGHILRCGLARLPLEDEVSIVESLVFSVSLRYETANLSRLPLEETVKHMREEGVTPTFVIVDYSTASELFGAILSNDELKLIMDQVGKVGTWRDLDVLAIPNTYGCKATVLAKPDELGVYTRVGDFVGITVHNFDRTVKVVSNELVR